MRTFGYSEAAIEQARQQARAEGLGRPSSALRIHPDNAPAVRLLVATQTQWRTVSLSTQKRGEVIRTGLDYAAVESTARLSGLGELTPADFGRLQAMEGEALAAWTQERAARR